MKRTPFTTAGDPPPMEPVTAPHSGEHVFAVPEAEQRSDPAASYPYVPPLVEEK
jgi:hypothetical protein